MSADAIDLPHQYRRRVLLMVTGLSPQVVTETLYALALCADPPFVPTEIQLLSTSEGVERARLMLLDPDDGRFHQFLAEYGLQQAGIRFRPEDAQALTGAGGEPLRDITTEEDNRAVADALTETVRALTGDDAVALHCSIAGGRKTMGFYLGYALSLYGRPQDRLSHVLVSEPFESDHQFYYPPARARRLIIRDRPVHTRDARVMLADIPFVRLREGLPERLLTGQTMFSTAVAVAQKALEPPELLLEVDPRRIWASGEPVDLPAADFAFYWWLAERRQAGDAPVRWADPGVAEAFLHQYRRVVGDMSGDLERAEQALRNGMDRDYFDRRVSRVNARLEDALGPSLAAIYRITCTGARPQTRYGIEVDPGRITCTPCWSSPYQDEGCL